MKGVMSDGLRVMGVTARVPGETGAIVEQSAAHGKRGDGETEEWPGGAPGSWEPPRPHGLFPFRINSFTFARSAS